MPAASSVTLIQQEARTRPEQPFATELPPLSGASAVCIGLAIDWSRQDVLLDYALRHTVDDEHARAARFVRAEDKLRNLLGRALLRHAAMHYGGMAPRQTIRISTWGKPQLDGCSVACNLSHSGSQLWVAATPFPAVGIDIESAQAPADLREITAGFHPDEVAALRRAPDPRLATMRCWSRKESVSKATGLGLSLPLRAYAVDCDTAAAGWLRIAPPNTAPEDWTTLDIPVDADHVGALAVLGQVEKVALLRIALAG